MHATRQSHPVGGQLASFVGDLFAEFTRRRSGSALRTLRAEVDAFPESKHERRRLFPFRCAPARCSRETVESDRQEFGLNGARVSKPALRMAASVFFTESRSSKPGTDFFFIRILYFLRRSAHHPGLWEPSGKEPVYQAAGPLLRAADSANQAKSVQFDSETIRKGRSERQSGLCQIRSSR